jgi:hypothetical protein
MYVRRKTIKGRVYYYLVKSIRNGDTIRQVYLDYIGPIMPTKKELAALKKKHSKGSR